MWFDQEALLNKKRHLDSILQTPERVKDIVRSHVSDSFDLILLPRVWEPGGGSTLFRCNTRNINFFLKVKHRSVYIESHLESEKNFIRKPSLQNEFEFIDSLNVEWVPKILFFDEYNDFQYLAFEWLASFNDAIKEMTVVQLIDSWKRIDSYTHILFEKGIVHTDIHEYNICFRNGIPVIIDFEEARFLKQNLKFEDSLDAVGENRYGNVGTFPEQNGIGGLTCLKRLQLVFKSLIKKQLPELISESNFDNKCPYNMDDFQEPDSRIYQSLNFPGLSIEGQRPKQDKRLKILSFFLHKLGCRFRTIKHLDIGSNLGMFCFQAAKHRKVAISIGLEAFPKYVELSLALGFLYNYSKANFFHFICGEEILKEKLGESTFDFVTMLSVYHHIQRKDAFLQELKKIGSKFLMVEFATQDRYYPERGGMPDEIEHIRITLDYRYSHILGETADYRRPLVLYSNDKLTWIDHMIIKMMLHKSIIISRLLNVVLE
jgi:tRNA A-37 threonylcarbamoyl transferase component Bud32